MVNELIITPNFDMIKSLETEFKRYDQIMTFNINKIPIMRLLIDYGDYEDPREAELEGKIWIEFEDANTGLPFFVTVPFCHAKKYTPELDYKVWIAYTHYCQRYSTFLKTLTKLLYQHQIYKLYIGEYKYLSKDVKLTHLFYNFDK